MPVIGLSMRMTADDEIAPLCRVVEKPRDPDRTRDLFGVQLEVTSLLLEGERRKLSVLQRELRGALNTEPGSLKAKERQQHELILAISRIQQQYDQLEQEYRQSCIGALINANTRGCGKSNRSQPAIGLKQTPKARCSSECVNLLHPLKQSLLTSFEILRNRSKLLTCQLSLKESSPSCTSFQTFIPGVTEACSLSSFPQEYLRSTIVSIFSLRIAPAISTQAFAFHHSKNLIFSIQPGEVLNLQESGKLLTFELWNETL